MKRSLLGVMAFLALCSFATGCKALQKMSSPSQAPSGGNAAAPSSSGSATVATPAPAPADDTSPGGKWISGMQSVLPSMFCKDKSYFRECFSVTQKECEQEAIRVTRVCLESKKDDIKNAFKDGGSPEEGKKWGEKVGECAGTAYEVSLKDKRSNDPKCNDVSQWVPKD